MPDGRPKGSHHGLAVIVLALQFVVCARLSLRGCGRVLALLAGLLGLGRVPCWTTGRLWLLRLGWFKLTRPKARAGDWVWLMDLTVQAGVESVPVVVGVRLACLPRPGQCLGAEDLEPLAVLPLTDSTGPALRAHLEELAGRTGEPRAIVHDHGANLARAVREFRQDHPGTASLYDATHKAACLLKHQLEGDARWQGFITRVRQTTFAVNQTALAAWRPPGLKLKARYMNVGPLVAWGCKALALVRQPDRLSQQGYDPGVVGAKLGWLADYQSDLEDWRQRMAVIEAVTHEVRGGGYCQATEQKVRQRLAEQGPSAPAAVRLKEQLQRFVAEESSKARGAERLPGSTEVLESCFAQLKALEGDHSRGGLTGLLLGLPALLGRTDPEVIEQAWRHPGKCVQHWRQQHLPHTVQQKRQALFAPASVKPASPGADVETKPG